MKKLCLALLIALSLAIIPVSNAFAVDHTFWEATVVESTIEPIQVTNVVASAGTWDGSNWTVGILAGETATLTLTVKNQTNSVTGVDYTITTHATSTDAKTGITGTWSNLTKIINKGEETTLVFTVYAGTTASPLDGTSTFNLSLTRNE